MDGTQGLMLPSKGQLWTGRVLSTIVALLLAFDSTMKLMKLPVVAEASAHLGYQNDTTFQIGIVLLVCVIIYAIPQTSRDAHQNRGSTVQPHPCPDVHRRSALAGTLSARYTVSFRCLCFAPRSACA
jgi:hypothetical protein